ncbi:MAG: hypothetical protein ACXVDD_02180 [Polyangia bacterium]
MKKPPYSSSTFCKCASLSTSTRAVLRRHARDERDDLRRQTRLRQRLGLRATSPQAAEQIAVPTQQRLWLDQDQGVAPVGEHRREANENEPGGGAQRGALHLARSDEKLVAQQGVLRRELIGLRLTSLSTQ